VWARAVVVWTACVGRYMGRPAPAVSLHR
jgi:hypothetical protein